MSELTGEALYTLADKIVRRMRLNYIAADVINDLKQEVICGILTAEKNINTDLNPDAYLFVSGKWAGLKYLKRFVFGRHNTQQYPEEGYECPYQEITDIDALAQLVNGDQFALARAFYGIGEEKQTLADLAKARKCSPQNIHQHIKKQVNEFKRLLRED